MKNTNQYWKQMSKEQIANDEHRAFVGGMWDEIGSLQFEFVKKQGLLPQHKFLDVGCGSLRGGIHFIQYLETGNYFGLDINESLIEAGNYELTKAALHEKKPNLLVNDRFEFSKFGIKFDFALALSVFTHLFNNQIGRCLVEIKKVLNPRGVFYASFFLSPSPLFISNIQHQPGNITTKFDSDPFHYSLDEIHSIAKYSGLKAELVEEWEHPRAQKMVRFENES